MATRSLTSALQKLGRHGNKAVSPSKAETGAACSPSSGSAKWRGRDHPRLQARLKQSETKQCCWDGSDHPGGPPNPRRCFSVEPWLSWTSTCGPGWSRTQRSARFWD